ncbi:MAG: putative Fe-S cluster assembly protein SufT [Omnitrophica bacterium RIFCSPHIGHO2_02_FULL_49_9]|nr:MAG: putative Fe-S cluster assembly protein SufT [Omnitrophica bacterium RIFCSPHIGHO2_02_FULL_49_9]OGW88146.1 MAG: putative Fe-S cluster assembly protein SufT [Omnitrophica bacterium RIFCSPLOWO2_01_FULL_50_24]
MSHFETVTLNRDCEATQIPAGVKETLRKGTKVHVTQSLGGSFTIMTEQGYMVRMEGKDADAIGKEKPQPVTTSTPSEKSMTFETLVWEQLKTCYDPEIPVNIVDLGLIYECKIAPRSDDPSKKDVQIKMTLTAPGCGMGESLRADAIQKIQDLKDAGDVHVELVWEPPWDRNMMSEAAKLQLGMI